MHWSRAHMVAAGVGGMACLIACSSNTAPRPRTEPLVTAGGAHGAAGAAAANAGTGVGGSASAPRGTSTAGMASASGTLDAGKVIVGGARTITYDASDGKGDVVAVVDGMPDCHCSGRTWWVREYRNGPGGTAEHETRYTFDAGGNVAVVEEIDRADRVEVEYTPPLVVVPASLRAQEEEGRPGFTQSVNMVVHPLGDRSKVRTHGPTTVEIRYVGDEGLRTGEGTIAAHRLMTSITANLSAARTVDTSEAWWADGIGLVGQKEEEKTMVLGAKVRDNALTIVMKSHGK